MKFRSTIQRLNWRQILIHCIASWFFIFAFQTFGYLQNPKMIDLVINGNEKTKELLNNRSAEDVLNISLYPIIMGTFGLILAFIISLLISKKHHWFWSNSLLAFLIIYVLRWFDVLGWPILKIFFLTPGLVFKNISLYLITNATILLLLGIFTFFNNRLQKFISNDRISE